VCLVVADDPHSGDQEDIGIYSDGAFRFDAPEYAHLDDAR